MVAKDFIFPINLSKVDKDIIPKDNLTYSLGSSDKRWLYGFITSLIVLSLSIGYMWIDSDGNTLIFNNVSEIDFNNSDFLNVGTIYADRYIGNFTLSNPDYDSGYINISQNEFKILTHNLGGNSNNYVIDFQAKDNETNINNLYVGLDKDNAGNVRGYYYFNLTNTTIEIYRATDDERADKLRVRIWITGEETQGITPAYIFAHTNSTIPVAVSGVWLNVTFDEEQSFSKDIIHNYNDETNDTFTINTDGVYDMVYHLTFQDTAPAPNGHITIRIIKNGVELDGSLLEEDSTKQYSEFTIGNGGIFDLIKGDEIKFQFTSDDTTISLFSHNTYGTHKDTAVIKIKRID